MKERYELWLQQCGGIVPNWRVRFVYRVFFLEKQKGSCCCRSASEVVGHPIASPL